MESSSSFTVETHDFSKRLSDDHLESLVKEIAEAFSVLVEVARDEALVGSVEEGVEVVFLHDSGDFLPLFKSGINTGRVMSASVQKNN